MHDFPNSSYSNLDTHSCWNVPCYEINSYKLLFGYKLDVFTNEDKTDPPSQAAYFLPTGVLLETTLKPLLDDYKKHRQINDMKTNASNVLFASKQIEGAMLAH